MTITEYMIKIQLEYDHVENQSSEIASCEYFTTNYLPVKGKLKKNLSNLDSFVIYMCVSGEAEITISSNSEEIKAGESVLIPANTKEVAISAEYTELLEVYIK